MTKTFFLAAAGIGGLAAAALSAQPSAQSVRAHPVVIELFQSQGCSSCPPALAVLDQEADRPDVLALNFAVTYWDQLGWKDIFAKPEFTARQWEYARVGGRGNVATPQLIVAGRQAVLGSRKGEVDAAIAANARADGPTIAVDGVKVAIGAAPTVKPATVWVVDYDPRRVAVPIRAGENGGRTLPHRNIVKQLVAVGTWTGAAATYDAPSRPAGLARAVLIQSGKGGAIVAGHKI